MDLLICSQENLDRVGIGFSQRADCSKAQSCGLADPIVNSSVSSPNFHSNKGCCTSFHSNKGYSLIN